jgi:predicted RNase H-like nuclease
MNRNTTGKGLSIQAWAIAPKIKCVWQVVLAHFVIPQ